MCQQDNRVWYIVALFILCFSILRGIRFPNLWSYTHFLFNYDFGFVKRGLIGEIASWSNTLSYDFFYVFSMVILIANMLLLYSLVKELIQSKNPLFIAMALIFVSSAAIVFLSHIVGYFDHIGLLITLIAIKITGFYKKAIFLFICFPFVLLIHEVNLILFFPIAFMSLLFSIDDLYTQHIKSTILALFAICIFAIGLTISNVSTISQDHAQNMYADLQSKIEHPLREGTFNVLHKDIKENMLTIKRDIWSHEAYFRYFSLSLLSTMPIFLFFVYYIFSSLKKLDVPYYLIILTILASLSPLILHTIAWDMHRWNTHTIVTSFLMFFIVYQSLIKNKKSIFEKTCAVYPIALFIVFLNGIVSIPLFDECQLAHFPFFTHIEYIVDVINHEQRFPIIPEKW